VPPASPTVAASPTAAATAAPTPDACTAGDLALKNPGRLTLSTDIPADPPWWGGNPDTQYLNEPEGGSGWELSDPYSMEGYEGATAYAIAEAMGFGPDEVDWLQNIVFEQAFAPGEKASTSTSANRDPYRTRGGGRLQRSVLRRQPVRPGTDAKGQEPCHCIQIRPITEATTIEELKRFKLGAAANTTSLELIEDVIQPDSDPTVYADNATALTALRNGGVASSLEKRDRRLRVLLRERELRGPRR